MHSKGNQHSYKLILCSTYSQVRHSYAILGFRRNSNTVSIVESVQRILATAETIRRKTATYEA